MNAQVWGPKCWDVLFSACYLMDPKETCSILECMRQLLPCTHCRRSFDMLCARMKQDSCITTPEQAAKWLWVVHDYVNSKLGKGKANIPYHILSARHATFTCYISMWDPIDMLSIITMQMETEQEALAYATLAPLFCRLSVLCGAPSSVCVAVNEMHLSPATCWLHSLSCKNAIRKNLGLSEQSRNDLKRQIEVSQATPSTTSSVAVATNKGNRPLRTRPSRKRGR
jgi:hypothetical protein